jgi:chemotaxis protein methyltransferase CheR
MLKPTAMALSPSLQEREFSFSDEEFRFLAELSNARSGIVIHEHKKDMVYSRLVRRLRALKLPCFADYCALLQSSDGQEEIVNLVNAITTNLTKFFRESHHFDHLRQQVLAPLAAQSSGSKRLRIWSAGCSAGMEPYSIAMIVKSTLRSLQSWDARILATDIDTEMLRTGEEGDFPLEQLSNIPEAYHGDVKLSTDRQRILMSEALKSLIAFKRLNLLDEWPMKGKFDAIFCRNVVIYFDKPTQAKLFSRMADMLKPDGWLYVGHSENLNNICDRFSVVGRTIYRKAG